MKHFFFILSYSCFTLALFAQKPVIDSQAIVNWPSLEASAAITNNGDYFQYVIDTLSQGGKTLVVQRTDNSWQQAYPGVSTAFFIPDSKKMIFQRNDSLHFLSLVSKKATAIPNVKQYFRPGSDNSCWLLYQLTTPANEWVLLNICTGRVLHFNDLATHQFSANGQVLVIKKATPAGDALQWVDLKTDKIHNIWPRQGSGSGQTLGGYAVDATGTQLVFMVKESDAAGGGHAIWYYKPDIGSTVMLASNQSAGITTGLSIDGTSPSFSQNGKYIFFKLQMQKDTSALIPATGAVQVDVWSYKDSVLQSTQLLNTGNISTVFAAVINPIDRQVLRMEQEDEQLLQISNTAREVDYIVLLGKKSIEDADNWWKGSQKRPIYLLSLKDASRTQLNTDSEISISYTFLNFSPGGKYLVYYDENGTCYYSYNLHSGKRVNISAGIHISQNGFHAIRTIPTGIAGWLPGDAAVLIYDNYDLWKIDPSGNKPPVSITNNYGSNHHIKVKLVATAATSLIPANNIYEENASLLLTAFDTINKQNGFFRTKLSDKSQDPQLLALKPCHIYTTVTQSPGGDFDNFLPLKARDANKWLVMQETETDAPNFFLTKDFKTYTRLTNLQPQQHYNWLTSELISWQQLDSTYTQGLLYKPENFDSTKKYPLIFYYYESMSNNKYGYPAAAFTGAGINIPWFVSRGYLVITPDIQYTIGEIGESVCNSIVSAARYAARLPWVDSTKMAITGHSFGGYETNYLVTHTNIFAAAASAAGMADLISAYGSLGSPLWGATSLQGVFFEFGQFRMGSTLWQKPELYIKNSPVFNIDKVTTPLLIMHNKADALVPWAQAIELFTGLRRLQKKVWMLQYDNGAHGVHGREAIDFTVRITQFFDHYLKETPPPKWMTAGIPAKLKGIYTGYELDTSGTEP